MAFADWSHHFSTNRLASGILRIAQRSIKGSTRVSSSMAPLLVLFALCDNSDINDRSESSSSTWSIMASIDIF